MLLAALAEGHATGMPQLDPSSFASQLFWLTVTFITLYLIISRSALPRIHDVLEKRRQRIQFDLSQAEEMTEQAEAARIAFEKQQTESRARSAEMIAAAQKDAEKQLAEEQAKLDAELNKKLGEAAKTLSAKRAELRSAMLPVAEELTQAIVEKIAGVKPNGDKVRALVKSFDEQL
ncbi:MAG: hypothetical protein U1E36_05015 [Rickettsiales bacterium]